MIVSENIMGRLDAMAGQVRELMAILKVRQNPEGISSIPLKEIAAALDMTRQEAKIRIDRLIEFGMIVKAGFNGYRIIEADLEQTPFGTARVLARTIEDMPNSTYEEQAAALRLTDKELEAAYGLLVYLLRT
ncbi:hypothetical protein ACFFNY_02230 [Paenibacillus hodogayensis]|uniref:HTH domain-containing protein n=1 Tax=Paenibacillus hodogayensis TaxID=279208 RepID=A0ABV5VQ26_9BACL